jgi:hypothetical protein
MSVDKPALKGAWSEANDAQKDVSVVFGKLDWFTSRFP